MILCWAAKGGSGTSVVAASLALLAANHHPTLLVDLAGDAAAVLGMAEPTGPGVTDWLASPTSGTDALLRLGVPATDGLRLIPRGQAGLDAPAERWAALATALTGAQPVVVDAGTGAPPEHLQAAAAPSLLVTRPCYLALRRAVALPCRPTGVVVVDEPGRALRVRDIEHAIGAPVVAQLELDPVVARAVDAGLLASRLPTTLARPLRRAA